MGSWFLTLGDLDLTPGVGGDVELSVFGLRRGAPVPVTRVIDFMLQDGGVEQVDRYENRDQSIIVGFRSGDSAALAAAESALFLECQKPRNELSWTPPDGYGPTTVFDVLWARVDFAEDDDWDLDELRGSRTYVVTLRCLPFGRDPHPSVAAVTSVSTNANGRESLRTLAVGGSARSQGSIALTSTVGGGLGDVLLYSCPALSSGYQPNARQFLVSGGSTTTDSLGTISGARTTMSSTAVFNVPADPLPRGTYVVLARMHSTTTPVNFALSWQAATKVGATVLSATSGTTPVYNFRSTAWDIFPVCGVTLPPTDVPPGSSAVVEFQLTGASALEWDEVWMFYMGDDAALTQVACGTGAEAAGSVASRLWVDGPTADRTSPAVWLGTAADRSDAVHADGKAAAWGGHSFLPGDMRVFVANSGAANLGAGSPSLSATYYKRYHTHAVA